MLSYKVVGVFLKVDN